jgi:hypothetical protein
MHMQLVMNTGASMNGRMFEVLERDALRLPDGYLHAIGAQKSF